MRDPQVFFDLWQCLRQRVRGRDFRDDQIGLIIAIRRGIRQVSCMLARGSAQSPEAYARAAASRSSGIQIQDIAHVLLGRPCCTKEIADAGLVPEWGVEVLRFRVLPSCWSTRPDRVRSCSIICVQWIGGRVHIQSASSVPSPLMGWHGCRCR